MEEYGELDLIFLPPEKIDLFYNEKTLNVYEMEDAECSLGEEEWQILEKIKLTPRQIQCVRMHYFQKFTHQHIADLLGICRPVVSIYLKRARLRIAHSLGYSCNDRSRRHSTNYPTRRFIQPRSSSEAVQATG